MTDPSAPHYTTPHHIKNSAARQVAGGRRWTGNILAGSLVVMVLSGLGLFAWHDVPQSQAATGSFLGIDYEIWSHAHLISSIVFTGAAVSHLRYNWKILLRYLRPNEHGA